MFVRRALLSVSDKTGLLDFARALSDLGVELVATTGTAATLEANGLPARPVSDMTGYPDGFLGGRVKTLQPAIYAGLLADRENEEHMRHLERHDFAPIDLLCLNLYPFGGTDQDDTHGDAAITHIDIGGPMLLRAAALNHRQVAAVTRPGQYEEIIRLLRANANELPEHVLSRLATQAFTMVASYEAQVSGWFSIHYGEVADPTVGEPFRIDWTRCTTCAGAVASPRVDRCLRHLEASERRTELQLLAGKIDLRNVQVAPSLLADILSASAGRDGRPRLTALQCEWTQFQGPATLREAIIQEDVDLSGARFNGAPDCTNVVIHGELRCRDTRLRASSFLGIRVEGLATFRGADLHEGDFTDATFFGPAVFEGADFASGVVFRGTSFRRDASFIGATFRGPADFTGAEWRQDSRFRDASFAEQPIGEDPLRFREAAWPATTTSAGRGGRRAEARDAPRDAGGREGDPIVFIGSSSESIPLAHAIQRNLDHDFAPVPWTQGVVKPGSIALEAVREGVEGADFAIFVLAADDLVQLRGDEHPSPRDNVVLEVGVAVGMLTLERTFMVKPRGVELRLPSDIAGIVMTDYDDERPNKQAALGAACTAMAERMRELGHRDR